MCGLDVREIHKSCGNLRFTFVHQRREMIHSKVLACVQPQLFLLSWNLPLHWRLAKDMKTCSSTAKLSSVPKLHLQVYGTVPMQNQPPTQKIWSKIHFIKMCYTIQKLSVICVDFWTVCSIFIGGRFTATEIGRLRRFFWDFVQNNKEANLSIEDKQSQRQRS